jgi:hypothetical protein
VHSGSELTCLLLGRRHDEWLACDLASGAWVRLADPPQPAPEGLRPGRSALRFRLAAPSVPLDPARPEAVRAEGPIALLAPPRRHRLRQVLRALAQPDRQGAVLLGSRGPSRAYLDLDPEMPSLALLRVAKDLELIAGDDQQVRAALHFGGVELVLPVADPAARRAALAAFPRPLRGAPLGAALGFKVGYALIGLDVVEAGHVRKVLFTLLPR